MKNHTDIEFGKKVRKRRLELGISQEALAEAVGISRVYMGNIERGDYSVTVKNVVKIAKALKLSSGDLFQGL